MTRYRPMLIAFVSAVLLLGTASAVKASPDPEKASRFVVSSLARAMALVGGGQPSRATVATRLRDLFRKSVDVRTMAASALGPASGGLTESEKHRYLDAFETQIVRIYTLHLLGAQPDPTAGENAAPPDMIRVKGTTPIAADQIMVHSRVKQPGVKWMTVDWRLRKKDARFLIVDIAIDGISQVQLFRSVFVAVMDRDGGGIESLIASLERLNAEMSATQAADAAPGGNAPAAPPPTETRSGRR